MTRNSGVILSWREESILNFNKKFVILSKQPLAPLRRSSGIQISPRRES